MVFFLIFVGLVGCLSGQAAGIDASCPLISNEQKVFFPRDVQECIEVLVEVAQKEQISLSGELGRFELELQQQVLPLISYDAQRIALLVEEAFLFIEAHYTKLIDKIDIGAMIACLRGYTVLVEDDSACIILSKPCAWLDSDYCSIGSGVIQE